MSAAISRKRFEIHQWNFTVLFFIRIYCRGANEEPFKKNNFRSFFDIFRWGLWIILAPCNLLCPRALLPIGYNYFNETSQASLLGCTVEAPVKIFSKFSNFRSFFEFLPSGLGNISDLCDVARVRGHYSQLATATSMKLHRLVYYGVQ